MKWVFIEEVGRLGAQPNTTTPATCHSERGKGEAPPNQTDPLQKQMYNSTPLPVQLGLA